MFSARGRTAAMFALYGVLSTIFCWPLFEFPNGLGISDWDQHFFYYGSVLKNAVEYAQLPFWNPWYCGGNVLWQNPQIAVLSPVYPLTSVMSLALAMKINIVLHYWVGFIGMHLLLTRILQLSYLPLVVYLASIFTLGGGIVLHLNAGHSVFLPAFYLPLLLFLFLRCLRTERPRDALPAAAVLALTIYNGGLHIVPIVVVAIGGIGLTAAVVRRRWRPLLLGVLVGIAGVGYTAPKLLPITLFVGSDQFSDERTGLEVLDRMNVRMMLRSYLDPYQNRSLRVGDFQRHGWFEYGDYIGGLAAILTAASIVWILMHWKHADNWLGLSFAVTTVLLLLFSAGEFSRFAPASLTAHVPLFSSFRVPSRYTIAVPLLAALTIGWAARSMAMETALAGGARLFVGLVCAMAALQLLAENRVHFNGVFPIAPLDHGFRLLTGPNTFEIDQTTSPYGSSSPMLRALVNGQSFYHCYESLQLRHTADADHAIVFGDDNSRISDTTFSPNRIEFSVVNGRQPSRITLNQNYARGWKSSAGPMTPDPRDGKPSVVLAPGQAGKYAFVFVPPGLWLGLGVFASAMIATWLL